MTTRTPGSLEERTTRLESSHEQMDSWFAEINSRFDSLNVLLYALGAGIIGALILQVSTLLRVVASG